MELNEMVEHQLRHGHANDSISLDESEADEAQTYRKAQRLQDASNGPLCSHCCNINSCDLLGHNSQGDRSHSQENAQRKDMPRGWYGPTLGQALSNKSECSLCEAITTLMEEAGQSHSDPKCRTILRLVEYNGTNCAESGTGRESTGPRKLPPLYKATYDWMHDMPNELSVPSEDFPGAIDGLAVNLEMSPGNGEFPEIAQRGFEVYSSKDCVYKSRCWRQEYWSGSIKARLARARSWLEDCLENHYSYCADTLTFENIAGATDMPTRVIEIPDVGPPRIVETMGRTGLYAALSYCWGQVNESRMSTLTTDNSIELIKSLPMEQLPDTIRDALTVTRELGLRYLWVDALCILQNDESDWLREAKNMGAVYQKAAITIAVLGKRDSFSGFLKDSENQPFIRVRPSQHCSCEANSVHHPENYLAVPTDSRYHRSAEFSWSGRTLSKETRESTWNNRTWTFQEQHLSRRILYFGRDQILWKCHEMSLSEDFCDNLRAFYPLTYSDSLYTKLQMYAIGREHGIIQRSFAPSAINKMDLRNGNILPRAQMTYPTVRMIMAFVRSRPFWYAIRCWKMLAFFVVQKLVGVPLDQLMLDPLRLLPDYTSRHLTFWKDRPLALDGLASVIAKTTGQQYKAGLWSSHVARGLFWRADGDSDRRTLSQLAPSWSWMSRTGRIYVCYNLPHLFSEGKTPKDKRLKELGVDQLSIYISEYMFNGSIGSGCLTNVAFLRGNAYMAQNAIIEPVSLQIKTRSLVASRSCFPCSSYEKIYQQLLQDVQLWPLFCEAWPAESCYMLFAPHGPMQKRRQTQQKYTCPECGTKYSTADERWLAGHLESCVGRPEANYDKATVPTDLFGIGCFDDVENPPDAFEALLLWHTRDPRVCFIADGIDTRTPQTFKDTKAVESVAAETHVSQPECFSPLEPSETHPLGFCRNDEKRESSKHPVRSAVRRGMHRHNKKSYSLLLVERVGPDHMYKRVGVGIGYWLPKVERFGGVQLCIKSIRKTLKLV